ncbi:MAG: DUF4136 domain-containing protein [Thiohalophilus sp.]|uniref:DUF4136 domain-containing protein n=1 Tax=Thiohalophilus sp. TaxID=3028392 RepID=UPI00286FFC3B|nr:DUF4136 domain-containing protein [Thiohalophilus sp.]MDR9435343.1 DUF4136 domain-containing protein [Thiohalophilus sp.]
MSALRGFILLLVSLQLVACSTTVNVDYDQSIDFATIRNFKLETKPIKISDDPRIDSSLMQQRVVTAIREVLTRKGLQTSPTPDVHVSYRIDVKQEIESDPSGVSVGVGTFSRNVGIGFGYGFPAADVESYDRIILTIDFHNPADKLLWRGSDSRRLTSGSTPETLTRLVNDLVEAILERYPPN